jgi:hypothetical protein
MCSVKLSIKFIKEYVNITLQIVHTVLCLCTRWHSWLKHCATNRKVKGLIPDYVTGIFHWHNPSDRTMALGLTQPVTEMSTRNSLYPGGLMQPVRRADLSTFMCQLSWNLGTSTSWNPQGLSRPVMGLLYLFICKLDMMVLYACVLSHWRWQSVAKPRRQVSAYRQIMILCKLCAFVGVYV